MKKSYLLLVIIFSFLFGSQILAQNIMKLGDVSVQAGQEATFSVSIDNALSFVAFQVDIPIPSGVAYVESSAVLDVTRKDDHQLSASIVSPNTLRLIGYSMSSSSFKGNSGSVVNFKLKAGQQPGNFSLTLNNPIIGDATSANILTSFMNGTVTILSPHIQLSVASLDFSRVALGQTQEQTVTINNTGNQPLQVTGITFTNPQFTAMGGSSFSLEPNGSKGITVRFTSQTKGTYKEVMSIASNDPALPNVMDSLKAVAFAVNEIHSGSLTALSGETKTLDFSINNMEQFTAFQFDIPLPATMQYVEGSAILLRNQDHQVSCSMVNGNTLRVVAYSALNKPFTGIVGKVLSLDFKIAGQAGWYPINLKNALISDVAGLNAMSDSYDGSLQVAAAQISTDQQLDFGDVSILSSKTQSLRVYNYGGDVLKIDQLIFSDPSFTTTVSLPLVIQIGNYAEIPVSFSKNSKGIVNSTLKIYSNDPVTNPFTVNLNANAFAPNYINVKDFNGCIGTDVVVTIDVDNEEDFVALQCDLKYPSYLTPKTTDVVLTDRKGDHTIQTNLLGNNTIRLVAFSMNQQSFTGKTGAVIQIPFTINANAVTGSYPLEISNGILGNSGSQNILYGTNNGTISINSPVGAAGIIAGKTTVDKGETETYSVPAITGATSYMWTLPTSFTGISSTNSITVTIGNNALAGSIQVKGYNSCGDGTESVLAINITDIPAAAGTITGNDSVCKGGTETYTVPSITGATSYIWALPSGATGASNTNTISVTFNNSAISGNIKVKGHNSSGDGDESTLALTVNDVPSSAGTITGIATVSKGTTETYTVPAITEATSYIWTLPTGITGTSSTNSITVAIDNNALAGSIKVKGHNICGDGTESVLAINITDIPAAAGTITGNASVCKGGTETYAVPAIVGATSYIWALPSDATGVSITNTISVTFNNSAISGNINVKGHNSSGDGDESTLGINVNEVPLSAGTITGSSTVSKGTTETYSVPAITGATSYNWTLPTGFTGASSTNSITVTIGNNALAGNIKVKGYNSCGDGTENVLAINITDIPAAAGTITGNASVCKGGTETYAVPAIVGATSYIWALPSDATGVSITNTISVTFNNSAISGNIKVIGHNSSGDGVESILAIIVNDVPSSAGTITGNLTVCKGGTETYTVQAISGATSYIWTLPSGVTGVSATNSITVTIGNIATSGSIKVKGHNSCGDGTESVLVLSVNDVPVSAGIISGNIFTQKGTTETYSVPTITGASSYIWTLPSGVTGISTSNSITVTIGNSAVAGNIKVQGRNSCGDGTESSLAITVNTLGLNYLNVIGTPGCSGTDVIVTLEVQNGYPFVALQCDLKYPAYLTPKTTNIALTDRATDHSIQVSLMGNNVLRVLAFSLSQQSFKGTTGAVVQIPFTINSNALAGSYALELSNVTLGNSQSQNIIDSSYNGAVVINTPPSAAGTITGNATVCKGVTETFSVVAIAGATSYLWTLPTGFTGSSTSNTITVIIGNTALSGSIKVKGNNSCGDGTESSFAIAVNDVPSTAGAITGSSAVCKGISEIYSVPVIAGATSYLWTLPTGITGTSTTNTITVIIGNTATSGSIKVKGRNSCGDGSENSLSIIVNDLPALAGIISGNITVCIGGTEIYTVPAIIGANSYLWTLPTGITGSSSTNSITVTISNTATSGSVKVKGQNGCGDGAESILAISVNDVPAASGVITGSVTVCKVTTETYSVPVIAGATSYIWTLPTGVTGTSITNTISITFSSTAITGSIKVKGRNDCGDGAESSLAVTVNSFPLTAGVITGNTNICLETSNITYSVSAISGATSYIWTLPTGASGTSTTNTISLTYANNSASGNLKVKGHNDCGDGNESSLAITVCLGVGIEDVTLTNKVEVYPNPTLNVIYVTINKSFKNDFKVEVCNNFGQIMHTILKKKSDNKFSVELTNYPTGLYFVRFSDKETFFHCKIVKQ